jgi:hypothetical protein
MIGRIIWAPKGSSRGIGVQCRHCGREITGYPFFSKNKRTRGGKKWYYHATCALELGLLESLPRSPPDAVMDRRPNPLGLNVYERDLGYRGFGDFKDSLENK